MQISTNSIQSALLRLSQFIFFRIKSRILTVLLCCCLWACDDVSLGGESFQSFAPDIKWGGRAVAVSVHPTNSDLMLAASGTGGIFKSDSGGLRWVATGNNGSFWSYSVNDVDYVPDNPRYIVATTAVDLSLSNNGGIWLSGNNALSFNRPTNYNPPVTLRCDDQSSAYGISYDSLTQRLYVGTDCGYAFSDDAGLTWSHAIIDTSGPTNDDLSQDRILNIVGRGQQLYAVGAKGVFYSKDQGSTWSRATGFCNSNISGQREAVQRIAVSDTFPEFAFVTLEICREPDPDGGDDKQLVKLYFTADGGDNWEEIRSRDDSSRRGFVRLTPINFRDPNRGGNTLYWGRGAKIERAMVGGWDVDLIRDLSWERLNPAHADIMDIAFDASTKKPLLLATDGGVELTTNDGKDWETTGSGFNGYQALQIYDVAGQFKMNEDGSYDHTDLYFGTQDNALWSSKDGGVTWERKDDPEGGRLSLMRSVTNYDNTRIAGFRCAPCRRFMTKQHFRFNKTWNDADHLDLGPPLVVQNKEFVQFARDTVARTRSLYYSPDEDNDWNEIKVLDKNISGLPKLSRHDDTWVTFPTNEGTRLADGTRVMTLRSISNITDPSAATLYSSGGTLGAVAVRGYQFVWTPVYGVSPDHPNHVIVPDADNNVVKYSLNGGVSWTDDTALTDLVTSGGTFDFYERGVGTMITEISFQPDFPNHIIVGTRHNGVFITDDGGLNWRAIPASYQAPHITSFFWDTPNNRVILSSYGRGLWRVNFEEGYLQSVPDNIRKPDPIDPSRTAVSPTTAPEPLVIAGVPYINGSALAETGQEITITGQGFFENTNQQPPVELTVDGVVVARGFPTPEGIFEVRYRVGQSDGYFDVVASQEGPNGKIQYAVPLLVYNDFESEDEEQD